MKAFVAVCVFAALLSGAISAPGASEKWASFKAKHGKKHAPHEDAARMSRFLERDAHIEEHNQRYEAGQESFSMQHNQYSDLSQEEFAKFALGFVPAVNASDIPFAETAPMPSLPASWDWRQQGIMTQVTNQGMCGSCYAFAATGATEAFLKWKTGIVYDMSEQDVVDCSYRRFMGGAHNGGCEGGWPTAVYQHWNAKDIVLENVYPYTSGNSRTHGQCRAPQKMNNVFAGRLRIQNVRCTEAQMAEILMSKGPLVVAIAADNEYKRYFDNLGNGVFDKDHAVGLQPNHAVVLVGFGTQNGVDYWLIKNSWGQWAMNGYGKIRRGRNMCGIANHGVFYVEM